MNEERVAGIVEMVEDMIYDDEGPNMVGILGLAKEADLTEE